LPIALASDQRTTQGTSRSSDRYPASGIANLVANDSADAGTKCCAG
jgi:hypothetical protein